MSSMRPRDKILLLDDNPRVRSFIVPALEAEGYEVVEAEDGPTAVYLAQEESFALIILDIMLADRDFDGLDVCKAIRDLGIVTPVIFLTVADRIDDPRFFRRAFELGADDYIAKREELLRIENEMRIPPAEFLAQKGDVVELLTRVRARIRRSSQTDTRWLEVGPRFRADLDGFQVEIFRDGRWKDAGLTRTQWAIFMALAEHPGRTVGRLRIIESVEADRRAEGRQETITERALEAHMSRLRGKLEVGPDQPTVIEADRGFGYRLVIPP